MTHNETIAFARKHKEAISLKPDEVKADLIALNKKFKDTAPYIRDQKAFNERSYKRIGDL